MKGDFSRIRFNPAKQYTAVLEQQGRVALDADANEQCLIAAHLRETETNDVVGRWGAPAHDPGFKITVDKDHNIVIGDGRYYVDGLLCENRAAGLHYENQAWLLKPDKSSDLIKQLAQAGTAATIRVFLQAWQRLVTALDDPCLREPALGQADTTARLQTVHRVVATLVTLRDQPSRGGPTDGRPDSVRPAPGTRLAAEAAPSITPSDPVSLLTPCCQSMYGLAAPPHNGSLAAQTSGGSDTCGCQPVPAAGYRGLENQLYRVEIHQGGDANTATFKWSRENGSVVTAIQSISGADVVVSSLGPDANLGFQVGQWVEISDDTNVFASPPNQPGRLYQIKNIVPSSNTITMTASVVSVDLTRNPRLRRWDQIGAAAGATGVPLSVGTWIDLENGIQVSFHGGQYFPGDYWLIPARTATGQIEWPPCGSSGEMFQPPHYTKIRTAPLACIHFDPQPRQQFTVDDCRLLFYPLTELTPPARPDALRVSKINWVNDDVMTLDLLVKNGLAITFDRVPDGPVTPANFVVTVETPILLGQFAATRLETAPLETGRAAERVLPEEAIIIERFTATTLRYPFILDSSIAVDAAAKTVTWSLPFGGQSSALQNQEVLWLNGMLLAGMPERWPGRARVRLIGKAVFAGTGSKRVFLDGEAFGQPALRADGTTPRIDLQLPSGNDEKATDFDSWFYLYPTLAVFSAQVTYTALTVTQVGGVVRVTASTPAVTPLPTAQQATVTLNYPALMATTINLSLAGPPGIVTAPPTVSIAAGAISIPVTLSLIGVPAASAPATFTLTASIINALGIPSTMQSQQFTITRLVSPVPTPVPTPTPA